MALNPTMQQVVENREADDRDIDQHIGVLLRTGVLLSAFVILMGGTLYILHHGREIPEYRTFSGTAMPLRSLSGIFHAAFHGNDLGIIQLGLLLLIATPVARVIFSVVAFWWERDHLYVVISTIVLAVLCYSLFGHGA